MSLTFTPSPWLIKQRGLDQQAVSFLNFYYASLQTVFALVDCTDDPIALKELAKQIELLEFNLQETWGFKKDKSMHRYWKLASKCQCPQMDNDERLGIENKIINPSCPMHGGVKEEEEEEEEALCEKKSKQSPFQDVLQAILIAGEDGKKATLTGDKTITIRNGLRDYKNGRVLLGCHILNWAIMGKITEVRHTLAKNITQKELEDDGYNSLKDMLKGLGQWYNGIDENSPVTIIRWQLI